MNEQLYIDNIINVSSETNLFEINNTKYIFLIHIYDIHFKKCYKKTFI